MPPGRRPGWGRLTRPRPGRPWRPADPSSARRAMLRDGTSPRPTQPAPYPSPPLTVFQAQPPYAAADIFKQEILGKDKIIFRNKEHYLPDALPKLLAAALKPITRYWPARPVKACGNGGKACQARSGGSPGASRLRLGLTALPPRDQSRYPPGARERAQGAGRPSTRLPDRRPSRPHPVVGDHSAARRRPLATARPEAHRPQMVKSPTAADSDQGPSTFFRSPDRI